VLLDMALSEEAASASIDIQDAFDSIVCSEDNFVKTGFQEGIKAGEVTGYDEGFALGLVKGQEIGAEIGFYRGFAKGWIVSIQSPEELKELIFEVVKNCETTLPSDIPSRTQNILEKNSLSTIEADSKITRHLKKLLQLSQDFPTKNEKDEDFLEKLSAIRAKFKHCCAMLKVETDSSSNKQLSF
jgi:flagellar biosynthesis/type III secretory pathway protein FliH